MTDAKRLYEGLDTNERYKFFYSALNKALENFLPNTEREVDDMLSNGFGRLRFRQVWIGLLYSVFLTETPRSVEKNTAGTGLWTGRLQLTKP